MAPQVCEYDRAIHAALDHWTEGDAKRLIKYEVTGGIDAQRELYIYIYMIAHIHTYIFIYI